MTQPNPPKPNHCWNKPSRSFADLQRSYCGDINENGKMPSNMHVLHCSKRSPPTIHREILDHGREQSSTGRYSTSAARLMLAIAKPINYRATSKLTTATTRNSGGWINFYTT